MNVHDSDRMAGMLAGIGCEKAASDADADLILFNTCTVREHAHHKAISEIGRAVARKRGRPSLVVGVCGCVAQEEKARLFEMYPELDIVFGPDQIAHLPRLLNDVMPYASCLMPLQGEAGGRRQEAGKVIAADLIDDPGEYQWTQARQHAGTPARVSEFIKIMKGCNNKCSFCIVPMVRGREISRPADDIIAEIKELAGRGAKEVTLLGQNVNSYTSSMVRWSDGAIVKSSGHRTIELSNHRTEFVKLLRRISSETGILRIRYTSPHPKDLGGDLIEEHAANPKLCRHMHLPLQAGSDKILRAMKRSYNRRQFIEKALKLRKAVQGIEITTDIIVGFPGETEKDFQDTLDVVREAAFDGMFAFKYSPRRGTKAAGLSDDVPQKEKEDRLARLLELNAKIWKERTETLVGTAQEVLVEGVSKKHVIARSETTKQSPAINYAGSARPPLRTRDDTRECQLTGRTFANKIVNFAGNLGQVGHIVHVAITGAGANSLRGELVEL